MKNLVILTTLAIIALSVFAFQSNKNTMLEFDFQDYATEWKSVDSLERQGLPESALKQVEKIYEQAKSDNNAPQLVKSVIYKAKYTKTLEEEGQVAAIVLVEKEATDAKFPVQPILQSMAAQLYDQYLSQNYWRIQNRTEIVENDNKDIETWTIARLLEKSSELYQKSIEREELQRIKTEDFKAILTEGKESEGLRPTLYDVLVFRALDHFTNERSYLTQPANKFYIDNKLAFAKPKGFVKARFETQDEISFKYQTLLLFQKVIAFHLQDKDPSALVDANLKRLKFVHQNTILGEKEELYLVALDEVIEDYAENPIVAEAYHQKAQFYYQKSDEIDPETGKTKVKNWAMAHEICEEAIEKYPDSFGAKECKRLIVTIESKSLSFQMEQVNLPNEPLLINIRHANLETAYFKLLEMDEEDVKKFNRMNYEEQLKKLNKQKTVRKWSAKLPQEGDYRQHTVETKIDALPLGTYVLMLAGDEKFSGEALTGYTFFAVSNIGYWSREKRGEGNDFVVFHRKTGEPMQGVTAEFYAQDYDRKIRQNKLRKFDTQTSDRNGFVFAQTGERYFQVKFSKGEDKLFFGDGFSNYRSPEAYKSYQQTHFFLDRAIYRPQQTIYYKAIILEKDTEGMPRILANKKVIITLRDANYQEVEKVELTTNEYGTVNGSFTAPSGGLLGNMTLQSSAGNGQHSFRVEEYKRPKFSVKFEPVKESYKLDEMVTAKGNAQAFAGNNIDGAKVQYRVVREVRYPWMPWWYRRYYNTNESMEIKNGETKTDANGQFEVQFPALPDRSADQDRKPEFIYTVYADVVDITGETHSSQTTIKVGTIALQADVALKDRTEISNFDSLAIITKNLNGQFEAAAGTITIQALEMPKQTYVKRYWQKADQQLFSEKEFKKTFPHYAYKNEDEIQNWKVGKTILERKFDTAQDKMLPAKGEKWKAGAYVLTMKTQDRYGQAVELQKHFTLYDWEKKDLALTEIGWSKLDKNRYEPQETAELQIATAEEELMTLLEVEKDKKIVSRKWIKVADFAAEKMKIEESDRGNFHYHLSYGKHNRTFNNTQTVVVPWSNKELKIEYATFRDKLKPGQEEEWQIKISGPKGEKVAAEMVATMYDASLDQFVAHNWALNPFPTDGYSYLGMRARHFNQVNGRNIGRYYRPDVETPNRQYQTLDWFGFNNYYGGNIVGQLSGRAAGVETRGARRERAIEYSAKQSAPAPMESVEEEVAYSLDGAMDTESDAMAVANVQLEENKKEGAETDFSGVNIRTNLSETVFFMPDMKTDKDGNIILKFTMNEALTKWKFLGLAHTQDLQIATTQKEVVTQKELMVQPNAPRFMREGDEIVFTAKVSNLTEQAMTGSAMIELLDATTMEPVEQLFALKNVEQNFTAEAGQSARLAWTLEVPSVAKVPALTHRVIAKAGNFSDGEESTLPILTNRMLVTETMPLPIRGKKQKDFTFASLANSGSSKTLEHQSLTLEFTSNPAWYAVQALPYLMEYPHECIEQTFNRYYANALATSVADAHPRIKQVFESWKQADAGALKSNLSKNQELKYALLEETPWVMNAQSEEEQKQNIALLFDLNRMAEEQNTIIDKLLERQSPNGGFAWFPGGRESWYMTQYIIEGIGHLDKLDVQSVQNDDRLKRILDNAVKFIDEELINDYEEKKRRASKQSMKDDQLNNIVIHYLYARSFFPQYPIEDKLEEVVDYYLGQAEKYWLNKSIYQQGLMALGLDRMHDSKMPAKIVKSLKERAIKKNELGMFWKYDRGYFWHQMPIETHALMIEVFDEIADDQKSVEELKIWLLKNKQTTHWKTTKATSSAVYALLKNGDNWLLEDRMVEIDFDNAGNPEIHSEKIKLAQQNAEVGTNYFKATWSGEEISADIAKISVRNPNKTVAWGGVYWQYFEQLDKIKTFEETPLQLKKALFKEVNSSTGPKLEAITEGSKLEAGDKVKVRIELRVDRAMEYVHMKDARASGFEPINVLSQYKYQDGLGYYESTRDASTNFFFSYLRPGTYVFEYPVRVVHAGDFSNGVTTIQCMYAPEFTSHSEGIRVVVE